MSGNHVPDEDRQFVGDVPEDAREGAFSGTGGRGMIATAVAVLAVIGIAVGVFAAVALRDQDRSARQTTVTGSKQLPQAEWVLAEGADKGLVQAYCTACHSLAPVVTHAGFTKDQWASEVQKMRTQYGAPIDDATAKRIIAYLQAHYTTDTTPPRGTSDKLYNDPAVAR